VCSHLSHDIREQTSMRGPPEAAPRPPHPIVVRLNDIGGGLIHDEDGVEYKAPPHNSGIQYQKTG
jgi:hypothetical protein